MVWHVYILRCSDNSLYTGITNNLLARLNKHQQGKASKYTRSRLPVDLIFRQECNSKSEALKMEIKIKKFSKKQKEALVRYNYLIKV